MKIKVANNRTTRAQRTSLRRFDLVPEAANPTRPTMMGKNAKSGRPNEDPATPRPPGGAERLADVVVLAVVAIEKLTVTVLLPKVTDVGENVQVARLGSPEQASETAGNAGAPVAALMVATMV